jgi:hypothetical protein
VAHPFPRLKVLLRRLIGPRPRAATDAALPVPVSDAPAASTPSEDAPPPLGLRLLDDPVDLEWPPPPAGDDFDATPDADDPMEFGRGG